jgi:cytochrome bd ubiquinol oxidase subunit II
MSLAEVVAALLVLGLTAYAVLAGADFGAGLWDLVGGRGERGRRVRALVDSSMGPVWEANHVWLIFVLVIFWTGFPVAFGSFTSTLYVPLFLAAVGIILRGAAFATRGVAGTVRSSRLFGALFALSSILTPFFLAAALGGLASGRVPVGNAAGDALTSWWNPTSVIVGALAVATGAYLAAVYMAADAARRRDPELMEAFRARALGAGVVAGAMAAAGIVVLREDARPLFDRLTGDGLPLVALSAAGGLATLALVWWRAFGIARVTSALAVAAVIWAWVVSQRPEILPGALTIEEAAAPRSTLVAVLVAFAVGALVLVPSLVYLFRLVLRGRLDKELPPISRTGAGGPLP